LYGVLKDYELNGKTIHTYIGTDHYSARVRNLHAYDSVSKDIVSRWSYPLCPDSNLLRGQSYRLLKGNIYKEQGVILGRSCIINRRTVIGAGTSIADGTVISNSVIGRNCIIGRNVTIEGAYIWGDAVIGDGSVIKQAIIANEAVVGKKCIVEPGALLSYAVRIADGTTVQGTRRITRAKRKRGAFDDEVEKGEPDFAVVGEKGDGFDFETDDEDQDDEVEKLADASLIYNLSDLAVSQESISTLNSDSDMSGDAVYQRDRSATSSFLSVASDDSENPQQAHHFLHEATNSLLDSLQKGDDPANIALELNSFRMSQDASDHQVRRAVAHSFTKMIIQLKESGMSMSKAVSDVIPPNKTLIERYLDRKTGTDDEVDLLLLIQNDSLVRKEGDLLLKFVTFELVRQDLISAEGIEEWWGDERSTETEELKKVREKTQDVVDAVLASDSDGEGDDDEDESEAESDED
jgi:carbonic anhydrase/acetyltransferase-like protein (isoleucine patch superfamily)